MAKKDDVFDDWFLSHPLREDKKERIWLYIKEIRKERDAFMAIASELGVDQDPRLVGLLYEKYVTRK